MITKAIVETMVDRFNAKVRIPTINMVSSSPQATRQSDLYTALICCPPGMTPTYLPGDVVYIDFEDGLENKPVIIGSLFKSSGTGKGNLDSLVLNADVKCTLPSDTTIGNVTARDVANLSSTSGNLQGQIDIINQRLDKLEQEGS